jgi:hypothetical protein
LRDQKVLLSKAGKGQRSENGRLLVDFENRWGNWIENVFQTLPEVGSLSGAQSNDGCDIMPNQLQLFIEEKYFAEVRQVHEKFGGR